MGTGKPDILLGRKALASYRALLEYVENLVEHLELPEGETLLGDLVAYTRK